jgi:hypothetical protein
MDNERKEALNIHPVLNHLIKKMEQHDRLFPLLRDLPERTLRSIEDSLSDEAIFYFSTQDPVWTAKNFAKRVLSNKLIRAING